MGGLAHYLKGGSNMVGIWRVYNAALRIQDIAYDSSQSVEEKLTMTGLKDAFVDAKQKLRNFYREKQEETEW